MQLFSGKALLRDVAMAGSLIASFGISKYLDWPLEVAVAMFIAGCLLSHFLIYPPYRRNRGARRYRPRSSWHGSKPFSHPTAPTWPSWQIYATAVALFAGTFSIVFFWPSKQTSTASTVMPVSSDTFPCTVSSVHDGDTLTCSDGTRVRLHAVAARELDETCRPGHPCPAASGASAKRALVEMALSKALSCEKTGNSYNRVAAICWTEQAVEINCAMIESGQAVVWPKYNEQRAICRDRPEAQVPG